MSYKINRRHFLFMTTAVTFGCFIEAKPVQAAGKKISVTQAYEDASAGRSILIDIRRPSEWIATGIGLHAVPMSIEQHPHGPQGFLADLVKITKENKGTRIDLICARGGRSKWLQSRLTQLGYTHVNDVTAGMVGGWLKKGWIKTGLPIEKCQDVEACRKAAGL